MQKAASEHTAAKGTTETPVTSGVAPPASSLASLAHSMGNARFSSVAGAPPGRGAQLAREVQAIDSSGIKSAILEVKDAARRAEESARADRKRAVEEAVAKEAGLDAVARNAFMGQVQGPLGAAQAMFPGDSLTPPQAKSIAQHLIPVFASSKAVLLGAQPSRSGELWALTLDFGRKFRRAVMAVKVIAEPQKARRLAKQKFERAISELNALKAKAQKARPAEPAQGRPAEPAPQQPAGPDVGQIDGVIGQVNATSSMLEDPNADVAMVRASAWALAFACSSIADGGEEARRAGDFAKAGCDVLETLVLDTKQRVELAKTAVTEAIAATGSILQLPDPDDLRARLSRPSSRESR